MLVEALSKGGKLNGVHIRALASAGAGGAANTTGGAPIGDEENHNLTNAMANGLRQQNATVGGSM